MAWEYETFGPDGQCKLFGVNIFDSVSYTHLDVYKRQDYDTSKLEVLLQGGLDLDDPIQLSEYIKLTPLEIAVFRNDVPMICLLYTSLPTLQRTSRNPPF